MNAFLMVIPNIVMRFQNSDIFENFVTFLNCRLLTPAACKVLIIRIVNGIGCPITKRVPTRKTAQLGSARYVLEFTADHFTFIESVILKKLFNKYLRYI